MAGKNVDKFANVAFLQVVESAANTLTYKKLEVVTTSILEKKYGLLIHRAELEPTSLTYLNTTGDKVYGAVTISNAMASIGLDFAEVLIRLKITRIDIGVAASGVIIEEPFLRDFASFPGGGIIVPADRLYLAVQGVGASDPFTLNCRLYYTVVELSTEDYWQLIESRSILST